MLLDLGWTWLVADRKKTVDYGLAHLHIKTLVIECYMASANSYVHYHAQSRPTQIRTHLLLCPITWKPIRTSSSSHDPPSMLRRSKVFFLMQTRLVRDQPVLRTHPVFLVGSLRFRGIAVRPARIGGSPG